MGGIVRGPIAANDRRVLLIGWDAADWRVIRPLLEQGKMPALQRMMQSGVWGNIATLHPPLSPMLWTSIATGKRPFKHGVLGFSEPSPDGQGVRPVTNLSRKTKAVWNMLHQAGATPIVVGWWPSHPAEPIRGAMVSNQYQRAPQKPRAPWPMASGVVHPARLAPALEEFRVRPQELRKDQVLPFVPTLTDADIENDPRLTGLVRTIAETATIQGAATALMQLEPWNFCAVYFDGVDHFCHGFMRYHPPRQPHVSERDFELYSGVVETAYRLHDMMLDALLTLAGDDATVILMSDHGFHPDHLRSREVPVEPAGPAIEHRDYGILVMRGPDIRRNARLHGASILDVCPTILTMYGLPIGRDFDGKPLLNAFEQPPTIDHIDSWDDIEGDSGQHAEGVRLDPVESAAALQHLVDLGYVEAPDQDSEKAVRECVRELRFNLAQSYMDAGLHTHASPILEELWAEWPREHRFGFALLQCLSALAAVERRADAVETLVKNIVRFSDEAANELETLRPELERHGLIRSGAQPENIGQPTAEEARVAARAPRDLQMRARRLVALASTGGPLVQWLRATQAMEEGRTEEAIELLEPLRRLEGTRGPVHLQLGLMYLRLEQWSRSAEQFEKALAQDPENAQARLGLAQACMGLSDMEGVVEHALSATELVYFNPRAHLLLGKALCELGDLENAELAMRVAVAQAPAYGEALHAMARLVERRPGGKAEARLLRRQAARSVSDRHWEAGRKRLSFEAGEPALDPDAEREPEDCSSSIVVVTGLPRSGTSMMMQVLLAGGMKLFTDDARGADENNPSGYFEHEQVKRLHLDSAWVRDARGLAVKVVAPLILSLPATERYRVIVMDRPSHEVVASQRAMLERLGRSGAAIPDAHLARVLEAQLTRARTWLAARGRASMLNVRFGEALADPERMARRVNEFLGGSLDESAMARAVRPDLRRHGGEGTTRPR